MLNHPITEIMPNQQMIGLSNLQITDLHSQEIIRDTANKGIHLLQDLRHNRQIIRDSANKGIHLLQDLLRNRQIIKDSANKGIHLQQDLRLNLPQSQTQDPLQRRRESLPMKRMLDNEL